MTDIDTPTFDMLDTYVCLEDGPAVVPIEGGDEFWATIDGRDDVARGRLVCVFRFDKDWPTWEMHPAGDEIVYLLSGSIDLILEETEGERTVELRGRAACIVPRGVWHRAVVNEASDVLHVTRGAGTEVRPA